MKGIWKSLKHTVTLMVTISLVGGIMPAGSLTARAQAGYEQVDGTTGVPLGGFGTGAVKFNAANGTFAAMTQGPADQFDYKSMGQSAFQIYTNVGGTVKTTEKMAAELNDGRYDDDAIFPEHKANFGKINGIETKMTGFAPIDNADYDNMSMPYAFYEMEVTNTNSVPAQASCALMWDFSSGNAKFVLGKGFTSDKWAVYGGADGEAEISAGNDNGFFTSGVCNNTPGGTKNRTAVKVSLQPKETKTIKFVLAWYDNVTEPEGAYYQGKYQLKNEYDDVHYTPVASADTTAELAGMIAQRGMQNFDKLKENADKFVNLMRGSNMPQWFVNQTVNSLCNLTNNSMYKKDGRVAFAEGEWTCFGTMDQMWHARQIIGQMFPYFAWEELEYWARTQRNDGQIHHDFNYMDDTSVKYTLCGWDDTEHADYRNVDKWVDLNCGFIISVYEIYQQTGDEERLEWFMPYVKKAGQRILDQVRLYGSKTYPYTFDKSENSYDAGGDPNAFNTSVSAVAYKVMMILAEKYNDTAGKQVYQTAYDTVVESYRQRYLTDNFPTGRISESYFAGQWLAMNLKLGQIWTQEETDYVINALDDYYHPYYQGLGYTKGTYDEWTPYLLAHYGGLLLNTRRQNVYEVLQKDSYNRQFKNRNYVFNHPLDILPGASVANYKATNISGDKQYISIPTIWRNYYDITGYHRDMQTKELWLTPTLLEEMGHVMTDAAYVSPEGYGTVSCVETATPGSNAYQNQEITFRPENDIYVSTLHLKDNFKDTVSVSIDGISYPVVRSGEGYTKELLVEYNKTVTSEGIQIITQGNPGQEPPALPKDPGNIEPPPVVAEMSAFEPIEAEKYTANGGISTAEENGVAYVTECDDQDYVKYDGVGFEDGAAAISLTVRSMKESFIELALGSVSGEAVAQLDIPNTNGEWQTIRYELKDVISGTQNVVLRFRSHTGDSDKLVDLDSFVFAYKYQIPRAGWTAAASKNSSAASNAFDNDLATRWNSSYQTGSEWYQLNLGDTYSFNKIRLDGTKSTNDYPRFYEVYVSEDGKNFGDCIASGAGEKGETIITFPRQKARYIKIMQTGTASANYWSIDELYVYNTDEEYDPSHATPTPAPPSKPDPTINEYTYTGTKENHSSGTKYFDLTKYAQGDGTARVNDSDTVYTFAENINTGVKAQFKDSSDASKISKTYTERKIDYIGTGEASGHNYNVKPALTGVSLAAGEYTIYYIGGNSNHVEVEFTHDTKSTVSVVSNNAYVLASPSLTMTEIHIALTQDYTGDIVFFNHEVWLPDLYAVKIVDASGEEINADFKVDTVYTADQFAEKASEHTDGWYVENQDYIENYEKMNKPFGELKDFENTYRYYTTADLSKTVYIPEDGQYRLNLLMREYNARGYRVALSNGKDTKILDCIENQVKIAKLSAADSSVNMGICYADTGEIKAGVYTLTFTGEKVNLWFALNMQTLSAEKKDYAITAVDGNQVTVSAKAGGYAVLYCANYDAGGQLVNLSKHKVQNSGESSYTIDFAPDKVFLWDSGMKPLDVVQK